MGGGGEGGGGCSRMSSGEITSSFKDNNGNGADIFFVLSTFYIEILFFSYLIMYNKKKSKPYALDLGPKLLTSTKSLVIPF